MTIGVLSTSAETNLNTLQPLEDSVKALLSIKPEFVERIFSGEKKFEYRKAIFKQKVTKVIIYCTMPVGKIVGEFDIDEILEGSPCELWKKTNQFSGVHENFYLEYFNGRKKGYAIKIGEKKKYHNPITPKKIFESFTPPQSFLYIDQIMMEGINNMA